MLTVASKRPRRRLFLVVSVLVLLVIMLGTSLPISFTGGQTASVAHAEDRPPMEQMRAFWVPLHEPGLWNHEQVDELVNNVKRANANTIIAQVRRHGDAMYNNSLDPRVAMRSLAPAESFDPLAYLIRRAHEEGISVHAWLVVSVTCRSTDALWGHPDHICTTHGPLAEGAERWTTATYGGVQVGDLDYGHPGAVIYFENVVQHLLTHYPAVDGVHLDFIRYGDVA